MADVRGNGKGSWHERRPSWLSEPSASRITANADRTDRVSIPSDVTMANQELPQTTSLHERRASDYSAGQSLASVLNNPKLGKGGIYGTDNTWQSWLFQSLGEPVAEGPPPLPPGTLPEVSLSDFKEYLEQITQKFGRFEDIRQHADWEQSNRATLASISGSTDELETVGRVQGEGLVVCLREIPPLYFDEDFALNDGTTFQAACPFSNVPASNMMLQEKLSHYLDLVEVHLVKEISARSDSFFDALRQLEDLNSRMTSACTQISSLRDVLALLDSDLIESARRIQQLSVVRNNLLALHTKIKLVAYVNQALSTLKLLVASGDCAAAMDVIEDLRRLMESDELVGLHCFRRIGDQLTSSTEVVNSLLAADFVRVAIHDSSDLEPSTIAANFQAMNKIDPETLRPLICNTFTRDKILSPQEGAGIREELLPLIIGLLRTARLPAVLRAYTNTLITDMKAAIKCVVAELLPVLFTRPDDGESEKTVIDDGGGGGSLAFKLRGLSPDGFVQLLTAVFTTVQTRLARAAEIRHVVEVIIGGLDDSYIASAVAAAFASGAAAAAAAEAAQEIPKNLLGSAPPGSPYKEMAHPSPFGHGPGLPDVESASSTTSMQLRADVLRENTEAVCAACDAAHSRWAKLLGVRALIHPKLRLMDFVTVYSLTQDFITATEKLGGRVGYSIRGVLQSQSKSFVDTHHSSRMSKIAAVLEQETWVAIDAPDEFQTILESFASAAADPEAAALMDRAQNGDSAEGGGSQVSSNGASAVASNNDERAGANTNGSSVGKGSPDGGERPAELASPEKEPVAERAPAGNGTAHEERRGGGDGEGAASADGEDRRASDRGEGVAEAPAGADRQGPTIELASPLVGPSPGGEPPAMSLASPDMGGQARKARERPSVRTVMIKDNSYHVVNSTLILIKMVAEYIDVANTLPAMAAELVHRVAEILKLFNSRTCQLVLGAGAMQVSGLKSITAKHLALASQSISLGMAFIPDVRKLLSSHIPENRKALLLTEMDRVAQDYRVHRDEIHSKLVMIMRDRLLAHLRMLPKIVEDWSRPDDGEDQPSSFAKGLAKEVGVLLRILSPLLLESDIHSIFTRVVTLLDANLADNFAKMDISSPTVKRRLYRDVQLLVACIKSLPSEPSVKGRMGDLERFMVQTFGSEQ